MPHTRTEAPSLTLLIASLAPIVWGTTYIVTTEWLPDDRPLLAALLRALPAGLVLLVLLRKLPVGDWWWRAAVLGVLNIGIFFALLFESAYRLPGGVAAVLGAVQPLVIVGLSVWLLRTPARTGQVVAGIAGVGGIALMVLKANATIDMVGVVAGLIGVVSMCLGFVLTKRWTSPVGPLVMTSWQLVAGGLFLLPIALLGEGMPPALSMTNVLGYAYLGFVGTAAAYYVWFRGIARLSPAGTSF
ncbi:MAG: transporter permease, partial [Thermoleophilia bacterium]|nr:transporter permease [Thermoleophilia bacterium]